MKITKSILKQIIEEELAIVEQSPRTSGREVSAPPNYEYPGGDIMRLADDLEDKIVYGLRRIRADLYKAVQDSDFDISFLGRPMEQGDIEGEHDQNEGVFSTKAGMRFKLKRSESKAYGRKK